MRAPHLPLQIGLCLALAGCAGNAVEPPPPAATPSSVAAKLAPAGEPDRPRLPGPWTTRPAVDAGPPEKCTRFSSAPTVWPVHRKGHQFDGSMHPTVRKLGSVFSLMDINGDARPDLVTTSHVGFTLGGPTSFHWAVALNTGSGFGPEIQWPVPAFSKTDLTRVWHPNDAYQVMDLDGDGKPDLVRARDLQAVPPNPWQTYGGAARPHWRVYLGRDGGLATEPVEWPVVASRLAALRGKLSNQTWDTVDMNGDKKPDLVLTSRGNNEPFTGAGGRHWLVYLNTGKGFAESPIEWSLPDAGFPDMFGMTSLRGGKHGWTLMDLNRDGRLDLVQTVDRGASADDQVFGLPGEPHWRVFMNTGAGFSPRSSPWWLPHGYFTHTAKPLSQTSTFVVTWDTFDIGGGGTPDLVLATDPASVSSGGPPGTPPALAYADAEGPLWTAFLNTGAGFAFTHAAWRLPDPKYYRLWRYSPPDNTWDTADMNGDGCFDLIDTGNPHGTTNAWHWKVYLGE